MGWLRHGSRGQEDKMAIERWTAMILVLIFLIGHGSCRRPTEEDRIKKVVSDIEDAAERKDIKALLGHISRSYKDANGRGYEDIKGLLVMYFFRHQRVSVYVTDLDVRVSNNTAEVSFDAVLSGAKDLQTPADILPEALGVYAFKAAFVKDDGEWKVMSASWEHRGSRAP